MLARLAGLAGRAAKVAGGVAGGFGADVLADHLLNGQPRRDPLADPTAAAPAPAAPPVAAPAPALATRRPKAPTLAEHRAANHSMFGDNLITMGAEHARATTAAPSAEAAAQHAAGRSKLVSSLPGHTQALWARRQTVQDAARYATQVPADEMGADALSMMSLELNPDLLTAGRTGLSAMTNPQGVTELGGAVADKAAGKAGQAAANVGMGAAVGLALRAVPGPVGTGMRIANKVMTASSAASALDEVVPAGDSPAMQVARKRLATRDAAAAAPPPAPPSAPVKAKALPGLAPAKPKVVAPAPAPHIGATGGAWDSPAIQAAVAAQAANAQQGPAPHGLWGSPALQRVFGSKTATSAQPSAAQQPPAPPTPSAAPPAIAGPQ